MANTLALDNAVKSALETADKTVDQPNVDDKKETTTDTTITNKEVPKEATDTKDTTIKTDTAPKLDDKQLEEAKELYTKIMDPKQGPAIVDWLARQAGYSKADVKEVVEDGIKKDAKELKNDILEALKGKLGPEFDFLSEKLAPAIESILDTRMAKHTEDIRETLKTQELQKLENTSATVYKTLSNEYFNTDAPTKEFDTMVNELIDEMPPSPGLTIDKYMRNLFDITMNRMGLTKHSTKSSTRDADNKTRADRNRNDATTQLASNKGARSQTPAPPPNTKMNLTDSIKKAVDQVNEALEK